LSSKYLLIYNQYNYINSNFYELESGGNIKLENGSLDDKWANSCIDLMKNRLSQSWLNKNGVKSLNIVKTWKIHNKKHKYLFDSLYENIVETTGKWGDDKKYYDFLFLHLNINGYEDIIKNIVNSFSNEKVKIQ